MTAKIEVYFEWDPCVYYDDCDREHSVNDLEDLKDFIAGVVSHELPRLDSTLDRIYAMEVK